MKSLVGQTIDHYRIEAQLGAGGIGVVYRAHDTVLERPVAVKLVAKGEAKGFDDHQLLDEARNASILNHPNICTIYHVGQSDEGSFIVMELIDGQPLGSLIPTTGLPIDSVVGYGAQVASAVAHAHARGIVHRDLKADNVVVTPDGRAKVLDFGLALRLEEGLSDDNATFARAHAVAGTLGYMPPEVLAGNWGDTRGDVWALGVLLHEMATGRRPFRGGTGYELSAAIMGGKRTSLPSSVPEPLRALVDRCLALDPALRFKDAGQVAAALEAIRAGAPLPDGISLASRAGPGVTRILVLPFADLSPGGEGQHFADGLTDEIITDLSNLRGLRVISRTSAMSLKDSAEGIAALADQLSVQYVLEGSVRTAGNALRVTAKLIEAGSDSPIWGQKHTGSLEEIFAVQERISRGIVESLELELSSGEEHGLHARPAIDLRAYESYLKAKQEMLRYSAEGLECALEHLRASLAVAGENVLLLSALGEVHWQYVNAAISADPVHLEEAGRCADKILALDPDSPHGQRLAGLVKLNLGETQEGMRRLRLALVRAPNDPDTLLWLSIWAGVSGYPGMAAPWVARLLEVDPLTPMYRLLPGTLAIMDGRFGEALRSVRVAFARNQDNPAARLVLGQALALCGERDEAERAFRTLAAGAPGHPLAELGGQYAHALAGEPLPELPAEANEALAGDPQFGWMLAQAHALGGDTEGALARLTQAVARGFINHPLVAERDPLLAPLREHERFAPLLKDVESRWKAFEI